MAVGVNMQECRDAVHASEPRGSERVRHQLTETNTDKNTRKQQLTDIFSDDMMIGITESRHRFRMPAEMERNNEKIRIWGRHRRNNM